MMKAVAFSAILAVYFITVAYGQSVTVNTATYFDNPVGGGNTPVSCRDQGEITSYGGPNQSPCSRYGYGTPPVDQGRWGNSAVGDTTKMSGLGFQGITNQVVTANQDFYLGQLTHFNWPIYAGSAVSQINMNVFLRFTVPGSSNPTTQLFTFKMLVDETPNQAPCPYPGTTPCSDRISFDTNSFNFQTSFAIDNSGVQYTLILEGFKESNVSSSSPVTYFISNENANSQGFLFARITAACPPTCANNGQYIITPDNRCTCDCTGVTCPGIKVTTSNCSCACPTNINCNGQPVNPNTCNCACANTCPSPQVRNNADCSCACPSNICHVGGTISDPTTCACSCPTTACPITNQVRNASCDCICNIQCTAPKVRSSDPNVCGCVCSNTCPTGFTLNTTNCNCDCTKTCTNSNLNKNNCTCGPCLGNWAKDGNDQCTVCPSTTTCPGSGTLNTKTCQCDCNINCNIQNGDVLDASAACACRKCRAGECICGNGIVEPGEQCDPGNNNDPCCQNCQFTTNPCDDGNACTTGERCSGTGSGQAACNPGNYKCPASTDCNNITCDPQVGQCVTTNQPDNTQCGGLDLCNARCVGGTCDKSIVECPADTNSTDCRHETCDITTGSCAFVPDADATGCSDNNPCTQNDQCTAGVCAGKEIMCPAPDQCHNATCKFGTCVAFELNGLSCNADNNLCTVGDVCAGGVCLPGVDTVCNTTGQCDGATCDPKTGSCQSFVVPDSANKTCDDGNVCTFQDICSNGTCKGVTNPALVNATQCGFVPLITSSPKAVKNTSIIIFAIIGAAVLIGAIAGLAILIKKIRDSKLLNPDTWNPDTFSSIGSNPLYKGSEKTMDNALYDANA